MLIVLASSAYAQEVVVQGPFKLKGVNDTTIRYVRNDDESISFVVKRNGVDSTVDSYAVGDGEPNVETVFFSKVLGVDNVVSLIYWDEENVNAIHYKINAYSYTKNGGVVGNKKTNIDKNLEGYDGYNGSGAVFELKNAASIKQYLKEHYR